MFADPPVSADPRIVRTDILKKILSCLDIVPCIFRQHPYFKNFETGLVRLQNTCENHLSILVGKNRGCLNTGKTRKDAKRPGKAQKDAERRKKTQKISKKTP